MDERSFLECIGCGRLVNRSASPFSLSMLIRGPVAFVVWLRKPCIQRAGCSESRTGQRHFVESIVCTMQRRRGSGWCDEGNANWCTWTRGFPHNLARLRLPFCFFVIEWFWPEQMSRSRDGDKAWW